MKAVFFYLLLFTYSCLLNVGS